MSIVIRYSFVLLFLENEYSIIVLLKETQRPLIHETIEAFSNLFRFIRFTLIDPSESDRSRCSR